MGLYQLMRCSCTRSCSAVPTARRPKAWPCATASRAVSPLFCGDARDATCKGKVTTMLRNTTICSRLSFRHTPSSPVLGQRSPRWPSTTDPVSERQTHAQSRSNGRTRRARYRAGAARRAGPRGASQQRAFGETVHRAPWVGDHRCRVGGDHASPSPTAWADGRATGTCHPPRCAPPASRVARRGS